MAVSLDITKRKGSHKLENLGKSYLLLDFLAYKMKYWLSDSQTNPLRKIGINRKWSKLIWIRSKVTGTDRKWLKVIACTNRMWSNMFGCGRKWSWTGRKHPLIFPDRPVSYGFLRKFSKGGSWISWFHGAQKIIDLVSNPSHGHNEQRLKWNDWNHFWLN